MTLRPNPGHCPPGARGKRVRGVLRDGSRFGYAPVSNAAPLGWAADGRAGCRWELDGGPFDIVQWEVVA